MSKSSERTKKGECCVVTGSECEYSWKPFSYIASKESYQVSDENPRVSSLITILEFVVETDTHSGILTHGHLHKCTYTVLSKQCISEVAMVIQDIGLLSKEMGSVSEKKLGTVRRLLRRRIAGSDVQEDEAHCSTGLRVRAAHGFTKNFLKIQTFKMVIPQQDGDS